MFQHFLWPMIWTWYDSFLFRAETFLDKLSIWQTNGHNQNFTAKKWSSSLMYLVCLAWVLTEKEKKLRQLGAFSMSIFLTTHLHITVGNNLLLFCGNRGNRHEIYRDSLEDKNKEIVNLSTLVCKIIRKFVWIHPQVVQRIRDQKRSVGGVWAVIFQKHWF